MYNLNRKLEELEVQGKSIKIAIIGVKIIVQKYIILIQKTEIFSQLLRAYVFGVISPKISTRTVNTPVAIPTPLLPKNLVASIVAKEAARLLTRLLPINIALKSLLGLSNTF